MARSASLRLPGTLEAAPLAGAALRDVCADARLSEMDLHRLELGLAEALNNVVLHGYRGTDGAIDLDLAWADDGLTMTIRDDGPPLAAPPTAPETDVPDSLPTGGWGLAILHAVMDRVAYRREGGRNVLTLVKQTARSDA